MCAVRPVGWGGVLRLAPRASSRVIACRGCAPLPVRCMAF